MNLYAELKQVWKKLGINGQVKNYSNIPLWVVETDSSDHPVARILSPGFKTPSSIDIDGFKRVDGKKIQGHKNWWKFYDFSTVEVYTDGRGLRVSAISTTPVSEKHFGRKNVEYINALWEGPLTVIIDIKRNSNRRIVSYYVSGYGQLDFETTFKMTCYHEIDNARPVFPKNSEPYIRSKRDKQTLNNFSKKGLS